MPNSYQLLEGLALSTLVPVLFIDVARVCQRGELSPSGETTGSDHFDIRLQAVNPLVQS